MPELPEVETVVSGLRSRILGYTIEKVEVCDEELLGDLEAKTLKEKLENKRITDIRRRGKYILIELDDNRLLTIHLRMTGKLLVRALGEETEHQRLSLTFREGVTLIMDNLRRFGTLDLLDSEEEEPLTSLGLEPFRDEYRWEEFRKLFDTTQAVKLILLDQKKIAGLGNIYANEVLFRANLNPLTPGKKISEGKRKRLFKLIPEVLLEAVENNGTTFDTFRDSYGDPGNFQNFLSVYQKEGEPCPNCGSEIVKVKQCGRSTYYCPRCQNKED